MSHFGGNLLPAAVSEPAAAVCLNSLICYTLLLHDNLAARLAALALQLAAGVCSVCVQLLVLFWNICTLAGSKIGKDFVLSKVGNEISRS